MRNIDKSTICTEKNHLEMGGESRSLTARPCGSCKTAAATVFCLTDSTFLCRSCDGKVHAVNKLASRHARVSVCEVCEQAPAVVTCKADAAALCPTCDRDIHSTNSLARRHERLPIVPFYDAASPTKSTHSASSGDKFSEEEAQAASWLLPDPNSKLDEESETPEYRSTDYLLGDMDPYHLDLDLVSGEQKAGPTIVNEQKPYSSDGVVPVQDKNEYGSGRYHGGIVDGSPAYDVDYPASKPFTYNFTSRISQNAISSSSLEVGVVPEHNATADLSKNDVVPSRVFGVDREARVLRYKEKRKNRRFEKTVRYASRKAVCQTLGA